MKRIAVNALYLTGGYPNSGFGRYLQSLLAALAEIDRVNEYALFTPVPLENSFGANFKNVVLGTTILRSSDFPETIVQGHAFKEFRPDIFFLPHAEFSRTKVAGVQTVVTVHDIIPTLFLRPEFLLRGKTPMAMLTFRGFWDGLTLGRKLKECDRVVTVSETSRADLLKVFRNKNLGAKTLAVPNGVEKAFRVFSQTECAEVLSEFGLEWKSYFFYFGGHTVRKNLGKAVLAHTRLPEHLRGKFPIAIIGEGYWKNWIIKNKLARHVRFLPKLSLDKLVRLVAGAQATLYPSLYEGFGFPILESLAAGAWPLVSHTPSSREILGNEVELADPYRVSDFVRLLRRALEEPGFIPGQVEKMRAASEGRFTWGKAAEKFIEVWEGF